MWEVEHTDEFEEWWDSLTEPEHISITAYVELLEQLGTNLKFPYSSGIQDSIYSHMRELRIQYTGKPYRVLYAFDPRRVAILLIGGNKTGDERWYKKFVPIAEKLYKKQLENLKKNRK